MNIGIDARVLHEGSGGIFWYAKNLLEHLIPLAHEHKIKLFSNQYRKKHSGVLQAFAQHSHVELYSYTFPNKFLNASFRYLAWPRIDELVRGCDALFLPSMLYGAWSNKCKTILTMHDLSYELFPELYTKKQQLWHKLMNPKELCRKVNAIISVSESTKRDLARMYGINPKKIHRVHSGIEARFRPVVDRVLLSQIRSKYHLPNRRYIIQTGTIEPRKNHMLSINAFERLQHQYPAKFNNLHLLIVGYTGWKSEGILHAVASSEFSDKIHILSDVPSKDVPALYSLARASLYPSLYEGFGFPPLEAAACGVPVIASSNSSLNEIVGDAGLLIDPSRVDEVVSALASILLDTDFAQTLRAKGLARTTQFSWEQCAKDTLKIITNS